MISENATLVGDFVQRFRATRRGARLARLLAVQQLDAWGVPYGSEPSDVAAAVVSELAANAALHGRVPGRDFELRLVLLSAPACTLRIEVSDARAEVHPAPPAGCPAPEAESGRGLFLVQALALRWGVRERTVGKTTWADVSTAPDASAALVCAAPLRG